MGFDNNNDDSSIYPSYEKMDHLPYLEKRLSIFEDEDNMRREQLVCAKCRHLITTVAEKVEVRGRHDHAFVLYGDIIQLGCYRKAPGSIGVERISNGYSWFRGYSWQIQVCEACFTQLGWKYMSQDDSFYGLMFKMLRQESRKDE
jgi:hypothetical protein